MITYVKTIRQGFLKNPIRVLHIPTRNIYRRPITWKNRLQLQQSDFEYFENLKLRPKGYEVIYVSPVYSLTKWVTALLPVFWAGFFYDQYCYYTRENYIRDMQKSYPNYSRKDKIMLSALMFGTLLSLHILQSMLIVATYRNKNQFQSVMLGFFGAWNRKLVPHGPQVMEVASEPFYKFKRKTVMLFRDGFRNAEDFFSVVDE